MGEEIIIWFYLVRAEVVLWWRYLFFSSNALKLDTIHGQGEVELLFNCYPQIVLRSLSPAEEIVSTFDGFLYGNPLMDHT